MAPENNWLSFSLSPMEMFNTSASQPQEYYYDDNFYANNGWANPKSQAMFTESNDQDVKGGGNNNGGADSPIFATFIDSHIHHQQAPKLEDFLGGDTTTAAAAPAPAAAHLVLYSDSRTETQDSSLTHMYGGGGAGGCLSYFNDNHHQQDLKAMAVTAVFQTLSANSGSEVDDSGSQIAELVSQSIESGNELGYSHCPTGALSLGITTTTTTNNNDNTHSQSDSAKAIVVSETCKKISDTFGQRTSIYRGVTRHRWTGRYEAHLWDNSCRREGQARKGRQVYLGGYDKEDKAARAYDLAALKYWGPTATTNFPVSHYGQELEEMKNSTKQEFIASLRRKSSGFSRGASVYRGVTRHHQQGRWQARIGRVAGNKDLYLGTFATEEEAAEAYDIAAIKFRGVNAVTNFEMNRYDVEAISKSSLPIGGAAKRLKVSLDASEQKPSPLLLTNTAHSHHHQPEYSSNNSVSSSISFSAIQPVSSIPYGMPYDAITTQSMYHQNLFHHLHQGSNSGNPETSAADSVSLLSMPFLPPSAEFFIWPHQSY